MIFLITKILALFLSIAFESALEYYNAQTNDTCIVLLKSCVLTDDPSQCTMNAISKNIGSQIRYPSKARENGKAGTVVFELIISSEGKLNQLNLLHHFGQGSEKEAKQFLSRNNLAMLNFQEIRCSGEKKSARLLIPVHFYLVSKKPEPLWEFQDIFCESKIPKDLDYRIRLKSLKKKIIESPDIDQMWKFSIGLESFTSFSCTILRNNKPFATEHKLTSITASNFLQLIEKLQRNDTLEITIVTRSNNKEKQVAKRILIR